MSNVFERIVHWVRAGYPDGVPQEDYVALLAVLHRRLTDHEVRSIADQLVAESGDGVIDREAIGAAITELAHEQPGDDDIARVAARLAAGGWPLAHPAEH